MKPYGAAWEAEDGTLHKTQEAADRYEHECRIVNAVDAWGLAPDTQHAAATFIRIGGARFLYEQGVRFPAKSPPPVPEALSPQQRMSQTFTRLDGAPWPMKRRK